MQNIRDVIRRRGRRRIETPEWLVTYGDMITLLLAFFIALFTTATIDGYEIRLILSAFSGLGSSVGGNTLERNRLAELGNRVLSLPSSTPGRQLDKERAVEQLALRDRLQNDNLITREDERGLVVSLGADAFFEPNSAEVDIEIAREGLLEVATLLQQPELEDVTFRIEGHTDSIPPDPASEWPTNWDLSAARSINILRYLVDYGVPEDKFQVMGLADTVPLAPNESAEGRALNRRVDIVLITESDR